MKNLLTSVKLKNRKLFITKNIKTVHINNIQFS